MTARTLRHDQSGSASIQFVVAAPVLLSLIYGILQISMVFEANAGLQNALGQSARYATIYPTPTDTAILAKATSAQFSNRLGTFASTCPATCITTDTTANTKSIKVTYSQPLNFLFFRGPAVSLTRTKTVYLSS